MYNQVREHLQQLLDGGIIRRSHSPFSSNVVLVKKKDGSIRFCVDLRDTNSKLKWLDSPIPLTADAIDRLASGQGSIDSLFLSTMDLASGFWCLPIAGSDKEVTTFTCEPRSSVSCVTETREVCRPETRLDKPKMFLKST